jgi:transposase
MEATGVYWKPVWQILEGHFALILANAAHVKNVPGRKSDVSDATWLADLLAPKRVPKRAAVIAGAARGARSGFTPARSRSSGRGYANLLAGSWCCRAGSTRWAVTMLAAPGAAP